MSNATLPDQKTEELQSAIRATRATLVGLLSDVSRVSLAAHSPAADAALDKALDTAAEFQRALSAIETDAGAKVTS